MQLKIKDLKFLRQITDLGGYLTKMKNPESYLVKRALKVYSVAIFKVN